MAKKHGNATHQDTDSAEYRVWIHIRRKKICCEEWQDSYELFLQCLGRRPLHTRLYRKDKTKPYGPDNCEWRESPAGG